MGGQYTLTWSGNCLATVDTTVRAARIDVSRAQTIPSETASGTTVAMEP